MCVPQCIRITQWCISTYVKSVHNNLLSKCSQVSGCLLQTAQTWANAGVCSASCAHAFGCMYVCLFVCYNLFVCFTGNLGDWVLGK